MFDHLFTHWRTFRKLMQEGDADLSYHAYSDYEDLCEDIANQGLLDEATRQAMKEMPLDEAGLFYTDLLNFACECNLDAEVDDQPAMLNARVFGIHAMGELEGIGKLHGNTRLVKAVRGAGYVEQDSTVFVAGALRAGEAARLTPQAIWDFNGQAATVLADAIGRHVDAEQFAHLQARLPLIGQVNETQDEVEIGSAVMIGVRVCVDRGEDPADASRDPLDCQTQKMADDWRDQMDLALAEGGPCMVLSPLPWKESVTQSIAMSAEAHILMQDDLSALNISKIRFSQHDDILRISGFDEAGEALGSYRLPLDISFWAMPEIIRQWEEQGIEVEGQVDPTPGNDRGIDLAAMQSPGKLLN